MLWKTPKGGTATECGNKGKKSSRTGILFEMVEVVRYHDLLISGMRPLSGFVQAGSNTLYKFMVRYKQGVICKGGKGDCPRHCFMTSPALVGC